MFMKASRSMVSLDPSVNICANTNTHIHIPTSNYQQMHCLHLQRFSDPFCLAPHTVLLPTA